MTGLARALALAALLPLSAAAATAPQFPSFLNYQGKLADTLGNPLTGTYSFRFRLYAASSGGSALFTDANFNGANAISVVNGIYAVQIGSLTAGGIPYDVFHRSELWLEIDVSPGTTYGSAETLAPRERLTTSPFAAYAHYAQNLGSGVSIATMTAGGTLTVPYSVLGGSLALRENAAPPLSAANQGVLYFDSTADRFMMSQNAGAYRQIQARVTGTCADGQAVTGVNEDGTVACGITVPQFAILLSTAGACPSGFEELESFHGRFPKGNPAGGTIAATVGTPLGNSATLSHTHTFTGSGGTTGATDLAHTHSVDPDGAGHTHPVDPPVTTSGGNSANSGTHSTANANGGGPTVAAAGHTHNTDIGSFTSGTTNLGAVTSGGASVSMNHTHSFTPAGTNSSTDHTPPYIQVRFCMKQ